MRKSTFFFSYVAVCVVFLSALFAHSLFEQARRFPELRGKRELACSLELTDLCLFTEARYTRHPSLSDFYAPFQDHPCSMEHFPSGSLIMPNRMNAETYAHMD